MDNEAFFRWLQEMSFVRAKKDPTWDELKADARTDPKDEPLMRYRLEGSDNHFEEADRNKEKWFQDRTDPVFGRPAERPYVVWRLPVGSVYEYDAPFSLRKHCPIGVTVNEFPLVRQKEVYLWLLNNLDEIKKQVPSLLLKSNEENLGKYSTCFYGVPTLEQAERAFEPRSILDITLTGTNPVSWTIDFDSCVDQDVYGKIVGNDEFLESVTLYM